MLLLLFKFLSFLFRSSLLAFTLFVVLLSLYSRVEDYMFLFPSPSLCSPSLPLPCFPLPPGSPSLDESSGFYAPHDLTNEILYRSFLNDKKTFILVCPPSLSLSRSFRSPRSLTRPADPSTVPSCRQHFGAISRRSGVSILATIPSSRRFRGEFMRGKSKEKSYLERSFLKTDY